jgi:hypothetical protein
MKKIVNVTHDTLGKLYFENCTVFTTGQIWQSHILWETLWNRPAICSYWFQRSLLFSGKHFLGLTSNSKPEPALFLS